MYRDFTNFKFIEAVVSDDGSKPEVFSRISQTNPALTRLIGVDINKCIIYLTYTPHDTTVKILKFGTPQTIAIIVLKIEKFDVTLH